MVRRGASVAFGCAVAVTLSGSAAALAEGHELPGSIDFKAAARVTVVYDDNALLGRRGQFLGAPGSRTDRKTDLGAFPSIDAEVGRRLGPSDRVSVTGHYELARLRTADELAGYDASAVAAWERRPRPGAVVSPSARVAYHSEQPEWTFRVVEPRLRAAWTFDQGPRAELRWRYTAQSFGRYASGEGAPKNSYANIDSRGQVAELELRHWLGRGVRVGVLQDFWTTTHGGNLSPNLAAYAGLPRGVERRDLGGGATVETLAVPWRALVVTAGGRYESNRSNSDAFRYVAVHAIASALVALGRGHSLFAQMDLGRYAFPDERFDRRYLNTRRDDRSDVAIVYRFEASKPLRFEIAWRRLAATSNDCIDFSPERDALGLPVYSRSYSCYTRTRIEASARWEL